MKPVQAETTAETSITRQVTGNSSLVYSDVMLGCEVTRPEVTSGIAYSPDTPVPFSYPSVESVASRTGVNIRSVQTYTHADSSLLRIPIESSRLAMYVYRVYPAATGARER